MRAEVLSALTLHSEKAKARKAATVRAFMFDNLGTEGRDL